MQKMQRTLADVAENVFDFCLPLSSAGGDQPTDFANAENTAISKGFR